MAGASWARPSSCADRDRPEPGHVTRRPPSPEVAAVLCGPPRGSARVRPVLERLAIRDLALVEHAEIVLGPGLNVVTGETGAGKSLLVQAVDLLMGGRADAGAVREGAQLATVEGEFRLSGPSAKRVGEQLAAFGIEFDGETLILRRELQAGGKTRSLANQSPITVSSLKRIGEILADLHGQHEHQSLLRADAGLETLDRLADLEDDVAHYGEALAAWREAAGELARLEQSLAGLTDRREWMEQAARELDEATPVEGEEESLRAEAARLAHGDRLRILVGAALEHLTEDPHAAVDAIAAAARALEQAAAIDPALAETLPTLDEARIAAGEAARALADYAASLEADPARLEAIEARREVIARLVRKHRRTVPELIAWRAEIGAELALGEDATGTLEAARARVEGARASCALSAQAVGERLRRLSRHRQIVCVTHLPMIAALASHHVRVTKRLSGERTIAELQAVEGAERVDELARMLAGDRVTETTRRQARELLASRT